MVLEVAGVRCPTLYKNRKLLPLEGKSLVPSFSGKQLAPHQVLFWEHEGNRAVRQGKWRLVADYNRPWELYDLKMDRTEQQDLSGKYPAKVKELAALYASWARRAGVASWDEFVKRRREERP